MRHAPTATAVLLTATMLGPVGAATASTSTQPVEHPATQVAQVAWGTCEAPDLPPVPATYQCATYAVPLDHADPGGETIDLGLIRRPADDPEARQGSLFLNFGGPGGPAVDSIALSGELLFDPTVNAAFDLVGVDPRGIGRSTPLRCVGPDDDLTDYFTTFVWPESARELRETRDVNAALDAKCVADAGPIREHMSTTAFADDLEILRQAVGDEQLNYVGYSYGSYLGSVYANRYPDRVGSFLLDAVLDPVDWSTGRGVDGTRVPTAARLDSDEGAEATLQEFFRLCDDAGPRRCAFAGDAAARYDALYEQLRAEPVVLVPALGLQLDHQVLAAVTLQAMYSSPLWALVAQDLVVFEQLAAGELDPLDPPVAAPAARAADVIEPSVLAPEQFAGVICSDSVTPDRIPAWQAAERRSTGYLGPVWAWTDQQCVSWSAEDPDRYLGPWDAQTANPVLLANPTFDPATDISGALALRDELPGSRLLTVEGWGHTTIGLSACAEDVKTDYLLTREVPGADVVCTQDVDPFPAPLAVQRQAPAPRTAALVERRAAVMDVLARP